MINRLWKSFLAVQIGCINASSYSFINLSKIKNSLNFILTWWWSDNKKCCIFQQKYLLVDKLECLRYNFSVKKKSLNRYFWRFNERMNFCTENFESGFDWRSESSNEIRQCGEKETRIKQPSWRQASIELWRESYCFLDNDISMLNHINSEEGIIENYGDYSTYIMPILKERHFIDLRQNTSKL